MYRVRGEVFDDIVGSLEGEAGARGRPWRVLDIGVGTGFYVQRWLARGATVTGCDLTAIAIERLRERFPDSQFIQADIGQPPGHELARLEGSFDAVTAFDVLFHIVDDTAYHRAIGNAARLLRPGGYFLWSDNFVRGRAVRVAHQVSRTLDEATAAVAAAGLEIVRRQPMFVLMNYPADTGGRLGRLAWTAMVSPALVSDRLGGILGRLLYPIERRLVRRVRESPSTEIMVCRKPGSA